MPLESLRDENQKRKVCVIGAGPCGLPAIKSCLDEELDVVCFECRNNVGGVWNYCEQKPFASTETKQVAADNKKQRTLQQQQLGTAMRFTIGNLNKETTSYSDFPVPQENPMFLTHGNAVKYYEQYAKGKKLSSHIRFGTKITEITQVDSDGNKNESNKQWRVTWIEEKTGQSSSELFDAVMVCVGHQNLKYAPKLKGQDDFQGEIIHSRDFSHGEGFAGKRVVVVGGGNSAWDIATELSNICYPVYVSVKRGMWMLPRLLDDGLPWDYFVNTRWNYFMQTYFPKLFSYKMKKLINSRMNQLLYGIEPNHVFQAVGPVITDTTPSRIACGAIQLKPEISRLTSHGVVFSDGSTIEDIDIIIFATGYSFNYPFINHPAFNMKERNDLLLYKLMFLPDVQPSTLALIGNIDSLGSVAVIGEMQSRYAARVFKGIIKLPEATTMRHLAVTDRNKRRAINIRSNSQDTLVRYDEYLDSLAEEIGCKPPSFWRLLLTDPRLCKAVYSGLMVSYQYRLVGPGAWNGARNAILGVDDRLKFPLNGGCRQKSCSYKQSCQATFVLVTAALALIVLLILHHLHCEFT